MLTTSRPTPSEVKDLANRRMRPHTMKQESAPTKRSVVPLIEGSHDDVHVVRLEGDRFILTAQQAIDFLSLASKAARFQSQFTDLLDRLYVWVEDRRSRISAAYISVSTDGITLLVVQKEIAADHDLEEELIDLDIDIANSDELDIVPFNTLLIPKVSDNVLKSFLSSGQVMSHQVNAE